MIRLSATQNGYADETVLRFIPEATVEYDGDFDAIKRYSGASLVPQIFCISPQGSELAISTLPEIYNDLTLRLGLQGGGAGVCRIKVETINFDEDFTPFLVDLQEHAIINLIENPTYECMLNDQNTKTRFEIRFSRTTLSSNTIFNAPKDEFANIYTFGKQVFIEQLHQLPGNYKVLDVSGKVIQEGQLTGKITEFNCLGKRGTYIVKAQTKAGISVQKIIITH